MRARESASSEQAGFLGVATARVRNTGGCGTSPDVEGYDKRLLAQAPAESIRKGLPSSSLVALSKKTEISEETLIRLLTVPTSFLRP